MKWKKNFVFAKQMFKIIKTSQQVDVRPTFIIFFAENKSLQKCIQYLSNYIATLLKELSSEMDRAEIRLI
jgi:hypothetical protein